ncbi:MAG: phosphonoacetaldehyde hydrolase [Deltaproteobacteria bacterium]|nr:phosphonoacetaldehyde hydrolase [Deltaproteobacteria bacterium]
MKFQDKKNSYQGPVQAVILDWAGTVIDYGCLGPVSVFVKIFEQNKVPVTMAEARAAMGLKKKDHIRAMCAMESVATKWRAAHGRLPTEDDVEAMYLVTEPMMVKAVTDHCDIIPGALEAIATLRTNGIKIGSTTGYPGVVMQPLRALAAERGYRPDSVVCPDDVPAGRPHPYMCFLTAINLKVYPLEACVKIGDTVADIKEGLNAGLWTIGLTKTGNELGLRESEALALHPDELQVRLSAIEEKFHEAGAHYVAESLGDCPRLIEDIQARLRNGQRP